jgi:hypothetical protein
LILRAVLREVCPMVIRVISMPDAAELTDLHGIFNVLMGRNVDLGGFFRIHSQELKNVRRKTRRQRLRIVPFQRMTSADTSPTH